MLSKAKLGCIIYMDQCESPVFRDSEGRFFSLFGTDGYTGWLELSQWPRSILLEINDLNLFTISDPDIRSIVKAVRFALSDKAEVKQPEQKEENKMMTTNVSYTIGEFTLFCTEALEWKIIRNGQPEVGPLDTVGLETLRYLEANAEPSKHQIPLLVITSLIRLKLDEICKRSNPTTVPESDSIKLAAGVVSKVDFFGVMRWKFTPDSYRLGISSSIWLDVMNTPLLDQILLQLTKITDLNLELIQYINQIKQKRDKVSANFNSELGDYILSFDMNNLEQQSVPVTQESAEGVVGQVFDLNGKNREILLTQMLSMLPLGTMFNLGYCVIANTQDGWVVKTTHGSVTKESLAEILDIVLTKFWK